MTEPHHDIQPWTLVRLVVDTDADSPSRLIAEVIDQPLDPEPGIGGFRSKPTDRDVTVLGSFPEPLRAPKDFQKFGGSE